MKPFASANPPPKSSTMPQGIFGKIVQLINPSFFLEEGITKRSIATKIASVPSLMNFGSLNIELQPGISNPPIPIGVLNTQRKINKQNRAKTRFSSVFGFPSSSRFLLKRPGSANYRLFLGEYNNFKMKNAMINIVIVIGRENNIQFPKDISGPSG